MTFYFILQFRRMLREFRALGVMPLLAIVFCAAGFVFFSLVIFRKIPAVAPYLYPAFAVMSCLLISEKERNDFLRSAFPRERFLLLRLLENFLIGLPFWVFLLSTHRAGTAAVTAPACLLPALITANRSFSFRVPSPFSARPYEFTTGFRRNYLLILALYGCSIMGLIWHNYNLGTVIILAISLLTATFYSHLDPVFYVWIYALSGKKFLQGKMKTGLVYGSMLIGPVLLPLMIRYPANFLISLLVGITGLLIIVLASLSAYVNFPSKMRLFQQFKFFVGIFFPPALLVIIPDFYSQASERLKVYLKC